VVAHKLYLFRIAHAEAQIADNDEHMKSFGNPPRLQIKLSVSNPVQTINMQINYS
jgi:hypothetical protein